MIKTVDEITLRATGGHGFGKKDDSDDLAKMNYAERLIMSEEFIRVAAGLKVAYKEGNTLKGGSILLGREDIPDYFEDGDEGVNGACHMINKVFVAAGFPLFATSYASENAEKRVKQRERGKNIGKTVKDTVADMIRIYRRSNDFNIDNYAAADSERVRVKGKTMYHQPTEGMYLRENKWLHENFNNGMQEPLEALGYKE